MIYDTFFVPILKNFPVRTDSEWGLKTIASKKLSSSLLTPFHNDNTRTISLYKARKRSNMPPTGQGRALAGIIGGTLGLAISAYVIGSTYELVRYDPPEKNPDGSVKAKKLTVRFQETSPLKMKPEAIARREKYLKEKEEMEQIIQEPTT